MLTEEQVARIIEAAKAEDATPEKLGAILAPIAQSHADAIIAETVTGLKANKDEILADLAKFKPFGKPEEIQAKLDELETLRKAPKGKKLDPKEIDALVEEKLTARTDAFRQEQEALRKSIEEERDAAKAMGDRATDRLGEVHRRMLLNQLAPDVRSLMTPFYEKKLGKMLRPADTANGEDTPWWDRDLVTFQVVDPRTETPLSGKSGHMTAAELVEAGRQGFGEQEWNSAEFRDTFFDAKGKGGGGRSARVPAPRTGAVDPSAPAHVHGEALFGSSK